MKYWYNYGLLIVLMGIIFFIQSSYAIFVFSDIQNHQYRESIQYLYDHNVVKGYADGTFGPDREISRAEILKIILEAKNSDNIGSGSRCFPDVKNEWFARYICYAKNNNIVKGYADGTFKPDQKVTIAEALKMSLETFGVPLEKTSSIWYQPYIDFVHNNSIFSKYSLIPSYFMKRGQMAYLIHQLMLEKEGRRVFTHIRDVRSPGCGKEPPAIGLQSSVVNGLERHYISVIGGRYNKDTPTKLIIAFHGRTNSNEMVRDYYDIEEAAAGNAIIVYPSGLPEENPPRNRSNPGDKPSQLRDFALFDQIVKDFTNMYCINMDQIFVVGHSLGARFTNSLSCARGDVIRAIGSVGGGTTINKCTGPVAGIIMQNPKDNLSSYNAAIIARDQMLKQNGCGSETIFVGPEGGNCVKYINCLADAPVIRCPHSDSTNERGEYYPHTWPDFAGQTIWNFFQEQK